MTNLIKIFRIRKEERLSAAVALLVIIMLNALIIYKYNNVFIHNTGTDYWQVFLRYFHISGYDPITYSVVTGWTVQYNVYRHPLLAFMMYPLYLVNYCLMSVTGLNFAQYIVAAVLILSAFYSFIFIRRIFRDVICLGNVDSTLLSTMFFSFAYIIVSITVPDHFSLSMFIIIFTLYISGVKIRSHSNFKKWQSIVLFLVSAGVTLNNGAKVFLSVLFADGKKFFRPANILFVVVLPLVFLWLFCGYEYRTYIFPGEELRNIAKAKQLKHEKDSIYRIVADTASDKDSVKIANAVKLVMKHRAHAIYLATIHEPWRQKGKPIKKNGFLSWTDTTTSRTGTIVENLFGESIQLHKDHLLEDILYFNRPIIVKYHYIISYIVESIIILLFIIGIWTGRHHRFLWLCISCFAIDMLLHIGLGFGINEIYIMGPHWLFVIPIAIAYFIKSLKGNTLYILRGLIMAITCYLFIHNIWLYSEYLFK